MSFKKISVLASILCLTSSVAAHGHVNGISVNGAWVGGFELSYAYTSTPPAVPGWSTKALDNGFVEPAAYGTFDIACHKSATAGKAYATVPAGSTIHVSWDTWPESHHGPVIDALASCGGDCTTATADSLKFFVISHAGLIDGSSAPGKWASDDLIANNNTWSLTIPAEIAPGKYVLRHEIIALHSAGSENGAQSYPQCFNLEITGSGTVSPAGIPATEFYTPTDPGILIGIYSPLASYEIPGPDVYSKNSVPSSSPQATSSFSASPSVTPKTTSSSGALIVSSAPALLSSVAPPFSNGTITKSKPCKIETRTKTRTPNTTLPTTLVLPDDKDSLIQTDMPTVIVVPTPLATATPAGPSRPVSTSPIIATSSESLPPGTKLSSVLAWISDFYATHRDGEYTSETAMKRRAHARHVRP